MSSNKAYDADEGLSDRIQAYKEKGGSAESLESSTNPEDRALWKDCCRRTLRNHHIKTFNESAVKNGSAQRAVALSLQTVLIINTKTSQIVEAFDCLLGEDEVIEELESETRE